MNQHPFQAQTRVVCQNIAHQLPGRTLIQFNSNCSWVALTVSKNTACEPNIDFVSGYMRWRPTKLFLSRMRSIWQSTFLLMSYQNRFSKQSGWVTFFSLIFICSQSKSDGQKLTFLHWYMYVFSFLSFKRQIAFCKAKLVFLTSVAECWVGLVQILL